MPYDDLTKQLKGISPTSGTFRRILSIKRHTDAHDFESRVKSAISKGKVTMPAGSSKPGKISGIATYPPRKTKIDKIV